MQMQTIRRLSAPRASTDALDVTRVATQLVSSMGQPLIAYLAELTGRGMPEVERARRSDGPVSPAEGAFAIWGPLFLGSAALALWSATGGRRDDPALRRIGWLATATQASNMAWSANAQLSGLGWRSLGLIGAGAASATTALVEAERRFRRSERARRSTWAVGPLAGWMTLASFANLEATLNETRGRPTPEDEAWRAAGLVGAAALTAGGVALASRGNLPFASAVAWGLGGTVLRNVRERRRPVAIAAGAGLVALAVFTWFGRRAR